MWSNDYIFYHDEHSKFIDSLNIEWYKEDVKFKVKMAFTDYFKEYVFDDTCGYQLYSACALYYKVSRLILNKKNKGKSKVKLDVLLKLFFFIKRLVRIVFNIIFKHIFGIVFRQFKNAYTDSLCFVRFSLRADKLNKKYNTKIYTSDLTEIMSSLCQSAKKRSYHSFEKQGLKFYKTDTTI